MDDRDRLAANVRERRVAAGISLDVLYARITHLLPEKMWGSTEMIRRLERGTLEKPNAFWVGAIAKALGCGIRELSAELAEEMDLQVALAAEVNPSDRRSSKAGRKERPSPSR